MKHIIALIAASILFAQCSPNIETYPTTTYDTLGVSWMCMERDNVTYYFQGRGVKAASIYSDLHEDAYNKLQPVFNAKLPRKLSYFVWMDWQQAKLIFNPAEWAAGFALEQSCACHVRADINRAHELVHILSYWANGQKRETYSRLVCEGVAVAFDLEDHDRTARAKKALEGKSFSSIKDFWVDRAHDIDPDVFYPVSGAFMEFIYNKNQPEKFSRLLRNQRMEEAEEIYGKDLLHVWMAEFDRHIGL